jgi:ubiquitin-conjugating enzyme E2 J2
MAKKACVARLRKELKAFEPPPYIRAAPLEHDLQEWRFVLQGPHDSPYEGGMYQGKLRFPDEYPFKPPSIMMITPNGRFETDRRLCLSISDFHPESWIPTWSVASIINGVLSFMLEDGQTTGSIQTTLAEKHRLRDSSVAWNSKDPVFRELFPELVEGKPFTPKLSAAPPSGEPDATAAEGATAASTASSMEPPPPPPPLPPLPPLQPLQPLQPLPPPGGEEDSADDAEPGQGRNAKANAKKREKEKAKKAAAKAAAASAAEGGTPAATPAPEHADDGVDVE